MCRTHPRIFALIMLSEDEFPFAVITLQNDLKSYIATLIRKFAPSPLLRLLYHSNLRPRIPPQLHFLSENAIRDSNLEIPSTTRQINFRYRYTHR